MPKYKARAFADSYGHAVGVLLPEAPYPVATGDIADAATFEAPVLYRASDGSLHSICEAARHLEAQGVRAIAAAFGTVEQQLAIAECVAVPVCVSALFQLPLIAASLADDSAIGIISIRSTEAFRAELAMAGLFVERDLVVRSVAQAPVFVRAYDHPDGALRSDVALSQLRALVSEMRQTSPAIAAMLLDGSVLSPYASALGRMSGIRVFDLLSAVRLMSSATVQSEYVGLF